jgi:hypothetical protein
MVGWAIGGTRLGMGARGGGYAAGDAWYVGAHGRAPRTPCDHAWGVSPCHHAWGVSPCHHAWGVSPCHHAWGVSPCDHARGVSPCDHARGVRRATMRGVYRRATMRGVYRRATMRGVYPSCAQRVRPHQPIHRPDHRCPHAFTEPMTPIRRGAPPCAPTIAGVGCWVAECMGAPPCHHARGGAYHRGVSPCAPNNRHQPIHRPDHRCPNAFTEPMTPIRRGAPPCAPTIAGVGCWVAGCMGAPPCHHAWGVRTMRGVYRRATMRGVYHRATMRGVYRRAPPTIVINPSTAPTIVAPTHSPNR